jgi:hypothetical protein
VTELEALDGGNQTGQHHSDDLAPLRCRWIKSFHIIFVASWFAGLFYLPRTADLAMVPGQRAEHLLLLMAHKLLHHHLAVPAIVLECSAVDVLPHRHGAGQLAAGHTSGGGGSDGGLPPRLQPDLRKFEANLSTHQPCVLAWFN